MSSSHAFEVFSVALPQRGLTSDFGRHSPANRDEAGSPDHSTASKHFAIKIISTQYHKLNLYDQMGSIRLRQNC